MYRPYAILPQEATQSTKEQREGPCSPLGNWFSKLQILTTSGTRLPVILGRSQKFEARYVFLSRRHRPFGLRPVLKIRRSESREQQKRRVRVTTLLLALLFASSVSLQKFVRCSFELICLFLFSGFVGDVDNLRIPFNSIANFFC